MKISIFRTATALVLAAGLTQPAVGFAQMAASPAASASASKMAMPKHHGKIDCSQVMSELNAGKKAKEVATDMSISKSSVYRCKNKMAEAKKSGATSAAPKAMASPATK
jgi:FixJ family two-component response regulator